WKSGHDVEIRRRRGIPATTWKSSDDVEIQPRRGNPATTWQSGHDVETRPRRGNPATTWKSGHDVEIRPRRELMVTPSPPPAHSARGDRLAARQRRTHTDRRQCRPDDVLRAQSRDAKLLRLRVVIDEDVRQHHRP